MLPNTKFTDFFFKTIDFQFKFQIRKINKCGLVCFLANILRILYALPRNCKVIFRFVEQQIIRGKHFTIQPKAQHQTIHHPRNSPSTHSLRRQHSCQQKLSIFGNQLNSFLYSITLVCWRKKNSWCLIFSPVVFPSLRNIAQTKYGFPFPDPLTEISTTQEANISFPLVNHTNCSISAWKTAIKASG